MNHLCSSSTIACAILFAATGQVCAQAPATAPATAPVTSPITSPIASPVTSPLTSQAPASGPGSESALPWYGAVKWIDSTSLADIAAAADLLKQEISEPTSRVPAIGYMTLAMCQHRLSQSVEALETLARMDRTFEPPQLYTVRGAMLRVALAEAIQREDARNAELAFKDLVRLIVAEKADSLDLRQAAHAIGATLGMLDHAQSGNLIPSKILAIGQNCMHQSKVRGVETAFLAAHEEAQERTTVMISTLKQIAEKGLDVVQAEVDSRSSALKQKLGELETQKQVTSEVIRNSREQIDQNSADQRKLFKEIASLNAELRQPTPGHPGPKRSPPPPPPARFTVRVEEYELITDYETRYQNGEPIRVPVTRQVRRPQYDIDRDRDSIYNRILGEYNLAMANYDRYAANYDNNLASWVQADQLRRREINETKADAEARREQLIAASKSFQEEKTASARELKTKRSAKEQEQFELEMMAIAIEAHRSGQPSSAFRPKHYSLITWSQEKVLLERYAK